MQGNKEYQEKLFVSFQLSQVVPEQNFYRRLKSILDLDFLLKQTAPYYGGCGQKSIDPRVFFKLCIVGYLENIVSDRIAFLENIAFPEEKQNKKMYFWTESSKTN